MTDGRMSQLEREANATRVCLLEARSNLLRTNAARMDLEGKVLTERLEIERLQIEIEKNAQAAVKQQGEIDQLQAKLATYEPVILKP